MGYTCFGMEFFGLFCKNKLSVLVILSSSVKKLYENIIKFELVHKLRLNYTINYAFLFFFLNYNSKEAFLKKVNSIKINIGIIVLYSFLLLVRI